MVRLGTFILSTILFAGCSLPDSFNQLTGPHDTADEEPISNQPAASEVSLALTSGSVAAIVSPDLISDAIDSMLSQSEQWQQQAVTKLVNTAITWDPTHDSAVLEPTIGINQAILVSNDSANGASEADSSTLAVLGRKLDTSYLAMGGNPFRNNRSNPVLVNDGMHQFLENAISWLADKPITGIKSIVIAHMDDSHWFRDYPATTEWLAEHIPSATTNARAACDDGALIGCLSAAAKPDLLIISQVATDSTNIATVTAALEFAFSSGIPVLYLHHDGNLTDLGDALLSAMHVAYVKDNYWGKQRITDLSPDDAKLAVGEDLASLVQFITRLENDTWSFDLSTCDNGCANQSAFNAEFTAPAEAIRTRFRRYDHSGIYLFSAPEYELDKLIILLADKYRESLQFPMDKISTPRNNFLRALFSDYAQLQRRSIAPAPSHLGNFSRVDFSHISPVNKTIQMDSRVSFRAAGVYALPGVPVTVTRNDASQVEVRVFVNTVRNGATHIWDEDGYKRPKFLEGADMPLEAGESFTFTSTYGGPIQLAFSTNDLPVSVTFESVGQHPYWNGAEDNAAFTDALINADFDWAELSTPAFEIHSKTDKMQQSAADSNWPTPSELSIATMTYLHNYPHVLAGFKGPGIDVVAEIHDFANANNWTIDQLDKVKHMNADQATCGYGCSGNPYDAYWSFNPIGHGDIHELGHGLERGRFRFTNADGSSWETHATTNPYSYYSKSKFFENTAQAPSCQNLPFADLYALLQAAQASGDAFNYMANLNMTAWDTGVATYIQMMMAVENQGILQNGWHLWPRLHMFEREFNRADDNDTNWDVKKANLGMPNITRTQAKALGNNDWMVLALSFISGRDFRDFFNLYGIAITSAATTQLDLLAYPMLAANFYGANKNDYCLGLDKAILPIDGTSAWPY